MVKSVVLQIKAIIVKNFICSYRNKEIQSEIILPMIASLLVSLKQQLNFLAVFAPMFLAIAINSSARSLLINLVEEKNGRFKETQKIMGMRQRAYTIGWIIYGYFKTLMSTFILLFTWFIFNQIINKGDFGLVYSFWDLQRAYWLYAFATLNQSLMLSTMFSSPKLASEVTTFITVMSTLLTFLIFITSLQTSLPFYIGLSLFPSSCISFAYIGAQYVDPVIPSTFPSNIVNANYALNDAALQLGLEAIIFFILYFYLDQVFPNEYGVAKDPLFFIKDPIAALRRRGRVVNSEYLLQASEVDQDYSDKDYSSAIYHQNLTTTKKVTVTIRDLYKKFDDFTAINNLSLNLYENEILCLLGHNGAGKTTTISVLTGLLQKTSGKVRVLGRDLESDLDSIRELIGICSQRDVLYDDLSVQEQLNFMGQVKGMQNQELKDEIDSIIEKTALQTERNKITKELSGGNKRKLSLAMALIGGSQVIFLDEPTSGMDAMSRRIIWEILERIKCDGRSLVLTTHHLDEAEILADRIAIMAGGKLLACGQSEYIKLNFGEGYQLQLTILDPKIKKIDIVDIIKKELSTATLDPQSSDSILLFIVPFKAKTLLKNFFQRLEQQYEDRVQVNLKMNSLEDAFVNIGMDEEKFMQRAKISLTKISTTSVNNQDQSIYDEAHDFKVNHAEEMQQIIPPECLSQPAKYIFKQQFMAIFLRKYYTTIRTFSNYVAIIIPFALIVIGTVIINQVNFGDNITEETNNFLKLVFISIFIILAFCFNSSIFISLPVLERESNLKYALNVMGCRVLPYWLGTFVFDYILFYVFVIFFVVFAYLLQLDFITNSIVKIFFIFVAFGLSYISFSYLCGVALYSKTSTAMKTFPLFNFFLIYCGPWNLWGIVQFIKQKNDLAFLQYVGNFFEVIGIIISPFYTLNMAFQNVLQIKNPGSEAPKFLSTSTTFYTGMLLVQFVWFSLATLYIENRKYSKFQQKNSGQIESKKSLRVDEAVIMEEQRVIDSRDPIKVVSLRKQYDNGLVAINDVSFGVQERSILGLLGPNGAGKSSMFNILTSLISKSSGNVKIFDTEVNRNEAELFKNVGICPQFDCIWENLTPIEHLYLFGRMKGLSGKDLDESVDYFIKTMQLEAYVNRKAGQLSGGNKRKLCVSDALIGGPCIQFFDEPSTGVDPIARRFLWKTLKLGVKLRDSSVVITTHTMDEAESLCDKIAILVNGQFYCLGSPQDLRDKFGDGYNITIKGTPLEKQDQVLNILRKTFPSVRMIDEEQREDQFCVHIPTSEFKFYRAFELLDQELSEQQLLSDFSINQSSLESVFIHFSKAQIDTEAVPIASLEAPVF